MFFFLNKDNIPHGDYWWTKHGVVDDWFLGDLPGQVIGQGLVQLHRPAVRGLEYLAHGNGGDVHPVQPHRGGQVRDRPVAIHHPGIGFEKCVLRCLQ